jgi:hypothetical protein
MRLPILIAALQCWEKGRERWLPLMVGRSINLFDHRAASVIENPDNLHNPFNSALTSLAQHSDPAFTPSPQFWVSEAEMEWPQQLDWALAFRDIARPTDVRTVIAAIIPKAALGNTSRFFFRYPWTRLTFIGRRRRCGWRTLAQLPWTTSVAKRSRART